MTLARTVTANTAPMLIRADSRGYYVLHLIIELLFGLTEHEARICWTENVSFPRERSINHLAGSRDEVRNTPLLPFNSDDSRVVQRTCHHRIPLAGRASSHSSRSSISTSERRDVPNDTEIQYAAQTTKGKQLQRVLAKLGCARHPWQHDTWPETTANMCSSVYR
jgi:hypothetical protein